jgi:amino acid permease
VGSFGFILGIVGLIILAVAMLNTYKAGRQANAQSTTQDASVSEKVQDHYVLKNPVFLAYIVAGILILSYLVYVALNTGR